ncbi:hypothetical protein A9Q84_05665 [Halobacteriovorax marinus]|uniref:Uncharacterized protein n=1 Tax=Halobacteriovorax marinus TaxID=97084 RepID=A0A1Y5FB19_9BACT|nr:hypothetical protein A9Q84_05665 [Halobacteriovorax marinus]
MLVISFLLSQYVLGSQCQTTILEQYNKQFQSFLDEELEQNSNKEIFKSIGLQSEATEDGLKLILNLKMQELKKIVDPKQMGIFKELVNRFFDKNKRKGTALGGNFFYPDDSNFPCMDSSLFLEGSKQCLRKFSSLSGEQVSILAAQLNEVYSKISSVTLNEIEQNTSDSNKTVKISLYPEGSSSTNLQIVPNAGSSNCALDVGKMEITCDLKELKNLNLQVSWGDLSDSIDLKFSNEAQYKLAPVVDDLTAEVERKFNVLKIDPDHLEGIMLSSGEVTIFEGVDDCSFVESKMISCEITNRNFTLKVYPNEKQTNILEVNITPENYIELRKDKDKNPLYSYVVVELYKGGKLVESPENLTFGTELATDSGKCKPIANSTKNYQCIRGTEPYNITAKSDELEANSQIFQKVNLDNLSLELSEVEITSVDQINLVRVKNSGLVIPSSVFGELKISLEIIKPEGIKSTLNSVAGELTSKRGEKNYDLLVVLKLNGVEKDKKKINISKYIAGDNFFFDIEKGNRFCSFKLMKIDTNGKFSSVGQSQFAEKFFDITVTSKLANCSKVEQTAADVKIFCSLNRKKLKGNIKVVLKSNDAVVRSVQCVAYNRDFHFDKSDDDDEEDFNEFGGRSKRGKKSKRGFDHEFAQEVTDNFTALVPKYFEAKYGTSQQIQPSYNPFMYNYGYPGQAYVPGYYTSPTMWDTMYLFNPGTY